MAGIEYNPVTGEVTAVNHVRGCAQDGGTDWKTGFMSVLVGGCCGADGVPLREVRLRFMRDQLLYDIKNYAYVEADLMPEVTKDNDTNHAQHQTFDISEKGNVDRVNRILSLVLTEVTEIMYPYTKEAPIEEEIDDVMQMPVSYEMLMKIPDTMSRTTLRLLSNLIHEYMVYRVMSDWLSITNKDAAVGWRERAEETKAKIESVKNLRRKAFTRKISPF